MTGRTVPENGMPLPVTKGAILILGTLTGGSTEGSSAR